jgi:hypothetical protein
VLDNSQNDRYLHKALAYLEPTLKHLRKRRISFLNGDPGPLALAAVIFSILGRTKEKDDCIQRWVPLSWQMFITSFAFYFRLMALRGIAFEDECLPEELLYGRVGYLYALLFLNLHLGTDTIDKKTVYRVSDHIG